MLGMCAFLRPQPKGLEGCNVDLTVPTLQAGSLASFSFEDCSAVLYYNRIYQRASHFPSSQRLHPHSSSITHSSHKGS